MVHRQGPSPTPTNVRRLHGETRPSRVNKEEPTPPPMEPTMPDWFDDHAVEVWDRTVYQLRAMHLLAAADTDTLVVYCQAVVQYTKAVKLVNSAGMLILGRDKNPVKNPMLQQVRDFGAQVRTMAGEFGLTPSARVLLGSSQKPASGQGAERYLS